MESTTKDENSNTDGSPAKPTSEVPPKPPVSRRRLTPWAVVLATVLVVINMGVAWSVLQQTSDFIVRDLTTGEDSAVVKALERAQGANLNESLLLSRIIEAEVHLRTVSNKHAIMVVAISASFILFVIGFALFIMGVEGTFELIAGTPELSKSGAAPSLIVRGSAPGMLCFALAVILAYAAVTRETSVQFEPFKLAGSQSSTEEGPPPSSKNSPLSPSGPLPLPR